MAPHHDTKVVRDGKEISTSTISRDKQSHHASY